MGYYSLAPRPQLPSITSSKGVGTQSLGTKPNLVEKQQVTSFPGHAQENGNEARCRQL